MCIVRLCTRSICLLVALVISQVYAFNLALHRQHAFSYSRSSLCMTGDKIGTRERVKQFFESLFNRKSDQATSAVSDVAEVIVDSPSVAPILPSRPLVVLNKKHVIIGGGISGLACAKELLDNGENDILVLEASDGLGGRVRTDEVDGYLLDRGFQVFIESYPEAQALFDYPSLQLKQFWPGALVRYENAFHVVSDPLRRPQDLLPSLVSPIGSLVDKIKVGLDSLLIRFRSLEQIFEASDEETRSYLANTKGLSNQMIDRFFSPFYQGIFLSPLDKQSSRMFNFVFKMFTTGAASLPSSGMGQLALQLMASIPSDALYINTKAISVSKGDVRASQGTKDLQIVCENVIVATDPPAAQKLLAGLTIPMGRSSVCLYFGIDGPAPGKSILGHISVAGAHPPMVLSTLVTDPVLILNGDNVLAPGSPSSRINNVCFPSSVSKAYAPEGKSLVSVTVVGPVDSLSEVTLVSEVTAQLKDWWGEQVSSWSFLRMYKIPYAQPGQSVPYAIKGKEDKFTESVYVCGDHVGGATLNGAIASGKRAAQSVLRMRKTAIINQASNTPDGIILKEVPVNSNIVVKDEEEAKRELQQAQQAVSKAFLALGDSALNVP